MLAWLWTTLADPWGQGIMRRAFAEVVLLGVAGGSLGCWILCYDLSYGAESLAHSLLPGLVIAVLLGVPLLLGGAAGVLAAAIAVALAGRVPAIGRDTAVAVVVSTLFGLGALLALSAASPPGLSGLLFGDVLGVTDEDLLVAGALAATVVLSLFVLHGRLLIVGFDRQHAAALGVAPLAIDTALLVMLAIALLVAVQGLGNLLVVAVLIAPAATARLFSDRMSTVLVWAAVFAVVGGLAGLYLSYYAGTAAGASIAIALVAGYIVAGVTHVALERARGCVTRGRRAARRRGA